jgi:hypothetical protein
MFKILSLNIRKFLDAYRDTIRITKHFDLIKLNGNLIVVKIFIIRYFCSFSFIRNFKKISYIEKIIDTTYFVEQKINLYKDVKQIDELGYSKTYNINNWLKEHILDSIFSCKDLDLKKINFPTLELIKKKDENLQSYFLRLREKKISRFAGNIDLKKNLVLKEFLTSKGILAIVKNYLNTNIVSINAGFFISNPVDTAEKEKYSNAQFFHWDNDFKKFLKFYIYLTDVDENSGPHLFVEKSHRHKNKEHKLCRLFSDDSVFKSYKNIKEFNGKSGSAFFVDSYGLHKAKPPLKKSRILLNVHFGSGKILYTPNDIVVNLNNLRKTEKIIR